MGGDGAWGGKRGKGESPGEETAAYYAHRLKRHPKRSTEYYLYDLATLCGGCRVQKETGMDG